MKYKMLLDEKFSEILLLFTENNCIFVCSKAMCRKYLFGSKVFL